MDVLNLLGCCLLLYLTRIAETFGEKVNYREDMGHIYTTIFHKYSERVRPFGAKGEPVNVGVLLKLIKINDVDIPHHELDFTADLTVKWTDSRLYWYNEHIKYITVNATNVWTPDIHFLDALSTPTEVILPRYLVVKSDGNIVWFRRLRVNTHCDTNGTAEVQSCVIRLGSHQFPDAELTFDVVNCSDDKFFENRKWQGSFSKSMIEIAPLMHSAFDNNSNRSEALCTLEVERVTPMQPSTPVQEQLVNSNETSGAGRFSFEVFLFVFVALFSLIS